MRAAAAVKRAALGAAAVAAWAVAWGSVPDDAAARWGPAATLAAVLEAFPWLTPLVVLPAALLGVRFLAGPPASRPRAAAASVLVAVSLLPAVPGLSHWTLYASFGAVAVAATVALLEDLPEIATPRLGSGLPPVLGRLARRVATQPFGWLAVAAAAVHAALTLALSFAVFGGVPHVQDSVVQLFQAKVFLSGALAAPPPPVPGAFEYSHMVLGPGGWLSIYPPGHALLLAAGLALGLPQAVNPLAGAAALLGVAVLARDALGERAGRAALLLTLVSPFWLFMHAGFMSHPTAHAALVWAVVLWRRGARGGGRWRALGAGLLFGAGFLIRPYPAVLVGAALGVAALLGRSRRALLACAWTAAAALPGVALALAYNAATTGDPVVFGYLARFGEAHLPGFHAAPWGPSHTPGRGLVHVLADLDGLNRFLLAWPLPFTLLLGAAAAAGRWRPPEAWLLTVPAALLAGHFAYWYADFSFGPRLVFESYFALALLAAVALRTLGERAGRRLALAVAVALVGSVPLWVHLTAGYGDAYWGVDAEESGAVAAAAAPDALVFVTGDYGGYLWRNDPRLERGPVFARRRSPAADRRVEAAFPERVPRVQPWQDRAP